MADRTVALPLFYKPAAAGGKSLVWRSASFQVAVKGRDVARLMAAIF